MFKETTEVEDAAELGLLDVEALGEALAASPVDSPSVGSSVEGGKLEGLGGEDDDGFEGLVDGE